MENTLPFRPRAVRAAKSGNSQLETDAERLTDLRKFLDELQLVLEAQFRAMDTLRVEIDALRAKQSQPPSRLL